MQLTITEKKENPLLSRVEVSASVVFDAATPKRDDVAKEIAGKLKADVALVNVTQIMTQFGLRQAKVTAHVYKDEAARKSTVVMTKHLRKQAEEAAKKAAEEAERKAEEEAAKKKAEEEAKAAAQEAVKEEKAQEPAEKKEGDA